VTTSLKAGADFKKREQNQPQLSCPMAGGQVGDQNNNRETRLIHARSKKNESCMSRNMKC
jgi:hypothetical protein